MHAGISTANAVSPMHDVMNHAHTLSGRRIRLMPWQRMSRVVLMKFSAPSNCPMQKMPMEMAQKTWPVPCPGPATAPSALRGAYAVQPDRGGPCGTKKAAIEKQKATNVTQNDIMLMCGKGMSSAPTWIGRK